jgi:hypothetical protein
METKPEYLSLREAAIELGVNRSWLKGHLEALNIPLLAVGKTLAVKRDDLKQVKSTKEAMA